ncbi:mannosyl-oligosaccharide alpha-1,2-mannosidase [Pichia californica]|nr:mannosyl-oligosaccharide alpha-1,2-mannosidase [[Candida] californica]
MSSFRPKGNLKSKPKYSNGLPQFYSYKDKAISNNYSQSKFIRLIQNFFHRYKKMLLIISALYISFFWMINPLVNFVFSIQGKSNNLINSPINYNPKIWEDRKLKVKDAFLNSWHDYVKHGWGSDVYSPVKQSGKNIGEKPLGWIIVDSLDSLILMDCKDELEDAKAWVDKELTYDINSDVNVFETTIRMLGGLLSAHYLSSDDDTVYLEKAVEVGNKLITAFDNPSGIPVMELNLHKERPGNQGYPPLGASTAEIATLQLEFKYLSNLTGEAYFWNAAEKVMTILDSNQFSSPGIYNSEYDGLVPVYVNQHTGKFNKKLIRLGSRGDSYYEYLLKQYLQTNEEIYLDMYNHAYDGIKKHLVKKSIPNGLTFIGELPSGIGGSFDTKMDHLVCFAGGLFALGATKGLKESDAIKQKWWNDYQQDQLELGKQITETCYHMYHDTPGTHLSPEIVSFKIDDSNSPRNSVISSGGDFFIKSNDKHNLQRPETVESLYILYKLTGDLKYREWGWEIFQNFIKYTKVTDGDGKIRYTTLKDCTIDPPIKSDNMESFWLAETLKYLYLLFDDKTGTGQGGILKTGKLDKWDLRNTVFNTEAHPLPKFDKNNFGKEWLRGVNPLDKKPEKAQKDEPDVKNVKKLKENNDIVGDIIDSQAENNAKAEAIREMRLDDETQQEFNAEYIEHEQEVNAENAAIEIDSKLESEGNISEKVNKNSNRPVSSKQKVSKPLNEQVKEAKIESDAKLRQGALDSNIEITEDIEHEKSKEIADRMKKAGEKPVAKQPVAKSLNDQAQDAKVDAMKEMDIEINDSEDAKILEDIIDYEAKAALEAAAAVAAVEAAAAAA